MTWDQERDDYEREDQRNDLWLRNEQGLQGDHDSPWSYGPWDIPPSHAEIASQDLP